MTPYLLLLAIVILDVAGTLAAKRWADTNYLFFIILAFLSLGAATIPFGFLMRFKTMAVSNVLWIVTSIGVVAAFDYLVFKQQLTFWQVIGFIVIAVGLALVNLCGKTGV